MTNVGLIKFDVLLSYHVSRNGLCGAVRFKCLDKEDSSLEEPSLVLVYEIEFVGVSDCERIVIVDRRILAIDAEFDSTKSVEFGNDDFAIIKNVDGSIEACMLLYFVSNGAASCDFATGCYDDAVFRTHVFANGFAEAREIELADFADTIGFRRFVANSNRVYDFDKNEVDGFVGCELILVLVGAGISRRLVTFGKVLVEEERTFVEDKGVADFELIRELANVAEEHVVRDNLVLGGFTSDCSVEVIADEDRACGKLLETVVSHKAVSEDRE